MPSGRCARLTRPSPLLRVRVLLTRVAAAHPHVVTISRTRTLTSRAADGSARASSQLATDAPPALASPPAGDAPGGMGGLGGFNGGLGGGGVGGGGPPMGGLPGPFMVNGDPLGGGPRGKKCRFYGTPAGCRRGAKCTFEHVGPLPFGVPFVPSPGPAPFLRPPPPGHPMSPPGHPMSPPGAGGMPPPRMGPPPLIGAGPQMGPPQMGPPPQLGGALGPPSQMGPPRPGPRPPAPAPSSSMSPSGTPPSKAIGLPARVARIATQLELRNGSSLVGTIRDAWGLIFGGAPPQEGLVTLVQSLEEALNGVMPAADRSAAMPPGAARRSQMGSSAI